jgi:hypothetical protein
MNDANAKIQAITVAVALALAGASAHAAGHSAVSAGIFSTRAIIGGDSKAIIGGDSKAIIGGDSKAIIGGDSKAIIGGDSKAIIGGDQRKTSRAIIGGDSKAIIGGDSKAIIGGDSKAIIGGDSKAIIGGDSKAIIGGDFYGFPSNTLVSGPVEKVDVRGGRVVILGQSYKAEAGTTELQKLADQVSSGLTIVAEVVGNKGLADSLGAAKLILRTSDYTPGATQVVVLGRVLSAQVNIGTFRVGQLTVDYTSILSTMAVPLMPGEMVAILGVQAAAGAPLVASRVVVLQ